ncbi:hypothetical protein C1J03_12595 [Sulfitobacter sp. SK012]|nr:hypothetical protein C1J03_12595 [Sulfitobacter sp. SK012]
MHICLLPLILALGSCAPLAIYYKPGVPVARLQADTNTCAVSALQSVPVNTQIFQDPPRYIPGRRRCNGAGNCTTRGGYYVSGQIYSVDVNEKLRRQTRDQCMAAKGYAPVSIPPCPDNIARAAPPGATTTLPPLDERSCVIRNKDGSYQIVTRG